jgi:hypothetical protein
MLTQNIVFANVQTKIIFFDKMFCKTVSVTLIVLKFTHDFAATAKNLGRRWQHWCLGGGKAEVLHSILR